MWMRGTTCSEVDSGAPSESSKNWSRVDDESGTAFSCGQEKGVSSRLRYGSTSKSPLQSPLQLLSAAGEGSGWTLIKSRRPIALMYSYICRALYSKTSWNELCRLSSVESEHVTGWNCCILAANTTPSSGLQGRTYQLGNTARC